jgi:hypothetical protein
VDSILAVGNAGTLTRSDADTGIITLEDGHTITTADVVDVYGDGWQRHGMTATTNGTVANSFQVDGGQEVEDTDDLPVGTAVPVVVCKQTPFTESFVGNELQGIAASAGQRAILCFWDSTTVKLAAEIVANGEWSWATGSSIANPLAGFSITKITVSNGSATAVNHFTLSGAKA